MPVIIGQEGVNHFQESFDKEGFTDSSLQKWPEVKRRDPTSEWYGFKAGSKSARPGEKRKKKGTVTNFSPSAARRKILTGETRELSDSIQYRIKPKSIHYFSPLPYASVHNSRGKARVFGGKAFLMPQRKFIGRSRVLESRLRKMIKNDLNKNWNA
jgi:phage gpG-like protein